MGTIKKEVRDQFLIKFPEEEKILTPFLKWFNVTWARKGRAFNTEISEFFLSPEEDTKEAYGFDKEIMMVYSPYRTMEPRALQAAELFLTELPAKGRIDSLNYFLV